MRFEENSSKEKNSQGELSHDVDLVLLEASLKMKTIQVNFGVTFGTFKILEF